jgi:hypothetical protein
MHKSLFSGAKLDNFTIWQFKPAQQLKPNQDVPTAKRIKKYI